MTIEAASAAATAAPLNVDDASAAASDDPAFDRLFGRDADGAPLWLRTEELLRIDDGGNVDDENIDAAENGEKKKSEETKSKDAFDAEAYIAEAKKLVRRREVERERRGKIKEKREEKRNRLD